MFGRSVTALVFLFLSGSSLDAFCQSSNPPDDNSMLQKFEKSVQPPADKPANPQPAPAPDHDKNNHKDDLGDELAQDMMDVVVDVVAELGRATTQRLSPKTDISLRRDDGDILIPFVRYDFAYQNISSNIDAHINRLEAGYGSVGLMLENYVLRERIPSNTLTINRQMLLYRMSMNRSVEVDFGLGQSVISGLQRTTLNSLSLPVKVILGENENIALELRPTWANTMDDYEIALLWVKSFGSLKIGYRSLNSSGATLNGPYAGFAFHY